ncbi:MAG: hypothetical protein JJD92_06750 [Frankiaceae bacterium]|nr:hypothetical protein [Frankiaceae bacterium]
MRTRTALTTGLVAVLAVGSFAPAMAGKAKPKPIKIAYTATGNPDPTSTNPTTNEICAPTLPTAIHHYSFKVPAAGTLEVALNNTLDWSVAVRAADGESLASSDGGAPQDKESTSVRFKKGQTISIDTCNFAGEPSINVTGLFTFK